MKFKEFKAIGKAIETFRVAMDENARIIENIFQVSVPNETYWLIARFYFSTQEITVNLFTEVDMPLRGAVKLMEYSVPFALKVINPHESCPVMCFTSYHNANKFHQFMRVVYESFLSSCYKTIKLNQWMCGYDKDRLPAHNAVIEEGDT